MGNDGNSLIHVSEFEWHRQARCTKGQTFRAELAAISLVAAFFRERDSSESLWIIGAVEVIVNIPGVKSGIESAKTRFEAQNLLGFGHKWKEIANIGMIESLSHFSQ